jgi:hypothetical protein
LKYRSSKSAEPFLLGAVTRIEQNKKEKKKKLTQNLYVGPLRAVPLSSADDEF